MGKLSVCPTPLGNLGDMTDRARTVLQEADAIYAEDTRVTGRLLAAFGIHGSLYRLDEARMAAHIDEVLDRVRAGELLAYCSDAGMPGVSDPGRRLVRAARDAGLPVEVLPGATALTTAYVASGCVNAHFYFGGFFPRKDSQRKACLEALRSLDAALIFYESPKRILGALRSIAAVFPAREVTLCRELTKLHEEVLQGYAAKLVSCLEERDAIRGEIVLVIEGPSADESGVQAADERERARERASALREQGLRTKDIAAALANEFDLPRNELYDIALDA